MATGYGQGLPGDPKKTETTFTASGYQMQYLQLGRYLNVKNVQALITILYTGGPRLITTIELQIYVFKQDSC